MEQRIDSSNVCFNNLEMEHGILLSRKQFDPFSCVQM